MASKRFIAGAQCSSCGEHDSIYIEEIEGRRYRACICCDFRDEMRFADPVREPETRVNRTSVAEEVRVVRLLTPDSPRDKT